MVIQTPRLCNDVAFQPPQKDAANGIACRPVLLPEEAKTYEHNQKAYTSAVKSAVQEAQIWESDPDAAAAFGMEHMLGEEDIQVVGDIIIGGHAIVPEDVKIERSAIVGGGKEKYVDTIASSWGKTLKKEDLEKLGLTDTKTYEALKKELENVAKGEKWKLDVVDTPRGREYRGIYGKDVEEDESGDEKKKTEGTASPENEEKNPEGDNEGDGEQGSEEEYFKEEL